MTLSDGLELASIIATLVAAVLPFLLERHYPRFRSDIGRMSWLWRPVQFAAFLIAAAWLGWWFIHRGQVAKLVHESAVTCVRFSPDSKSLFSGTVNGVVREWDVSSRNDVATFRSVLPSISFVAADAEHVVAGGEGNVAIWDRASRVQKGTLRPDDGGVYAVNAILLPKENSLLVAWWNQITKFNLDDLQPTVRFQMNGSLLGGFTLDGTKSRVAAFVGTPQNVQYWDLVTGRLQVDPNLERALSNGVEALLIDSFSSQMRALTFSSDQKHFFCAGHFFAAEHAQLNDIVAWTVDPPAERFRLKGHEQAINSLALTARDRFLLSGSDDGTVRLWDIDTKSERFVYRGHLDWPKEHQVSDVAVSPDGQWAASGGKDGSVRIWQLPHSTSKENTVD